MDSLITVTVTAADADRLRTLARTLVDERLIACSNIVPQVMSVYRWGGAVQDDDEALMILHTRAGLQDDLIARIVADHPYDEPQVVVLPVLSAAEGYRRWVIDSTSEPS